MAAISRWFGMAGSQIPNAVLFQICWFTCVLGGARGTSIWGVLAVAALGAETLLRRPGSDLLLVGLLVPVGFVLDSLWIHFGVLDYGAALAPPWIVLLWAAVALTVNHSLAFLKPRPLLGGLLAGSCAPLSYLMGARLGAVTVPDPWLLASVGVVWFALFTVLFAGARAWDSEGLDGVRKAVRLP